MASAAQRPTPKSTVIRWFATWRDNGLFEAIDHSQVLADREHAGRETSPTAVVLDSQSEDGDPSGYDIGKTTRGRKRQVMVDTNGLIFEPQAASVQNRDGAPTVLRLSRGLFPFVNKAATDDLGSTPTRQSRSQKPSSKRPAS